MPGDHRKAIRRKIEKLCAERPDEVIAAILGTPFWPQGISENTFYKRHDDDTRNGTIAIAFMRDGDGWLEVRSKLDPEDPYTHRFRIPLIGGGESPNVHTALKILAFAIMRDNQDHPQKKAIAAQ